MNKFVFVLIVVLSISACTKKNQHVAEVKQFQIKQLPSDFKIPKKIFEKIQEHAKSESKLISPVFIFLPVQVQLKSFQKNVIVDNEVNITFPNGGGTLDLKDFIRNQGTFSLSFPKSAFVDGLEMFDFVFVSNTKQQFLDGDKVGLGCNFAVQMTALYPKFNSSDFLKVNTTDFRHLNVIGGQFILVFKKSNQYYLTHINVIDSTQPELFCSGLDIKNETI